jgi:methionyl-tRNA formyltransferase
VRIIFLGTPEFAVPTLVRLIEENDFEVVGVVCQPDRPKGRGNKIVAPPVKETAVRHGIPVLQPEKLSRSPEIVEAMRELKPDVIVMVAFGQILKEVVLQLPPMGVINIHGSLLPQYRGAAPINWSIINGETVTGITTMQTEAGVDTGPMLLKGETEIGENITAPELADALSKVGADLIVKTLRGLKDGSVKPERQNDDEATFAPIMTKEMGELDWSKPAREIHNLVRGLVPWPGTSTVFRGTPLKIVTTELPKDGTEIQQASKAPGTVLLVNKDVVIACGAEGNERLRLITVKPQGKGDIPARSWINGIHLQDEERFESFQQVANKS